MKATEKKVGKTGKKFVKAEPCTIGDVAEVRIKCNGLKENLESAETLLTLLKVFQ